MLRGVGSIPVESEVPLEPSKFQELSRSGEDQVRLRGAQGGTQKALIRPRYALSSERSG